MSFYVDAGDQRAKARRAEQRLMEHSLNRTPRRVQMDTEEEEISSLPPVFKREYGYDHSRETSLDKRSARFRDTHIYGPPPPPPTPDGAIPRLLPPPKFLVPQNIADQGIVNDPRYAVQPVDPRYSQPLNPQYPPPPPPGQNGFPPQQYPPVQQPYPPQVQQPPIPSSQQEQIWYEDSEPEEQPRYRMTSQGLVPNVPSNPGAAVPKPEIPFQPGDPEYIRRFDAYGGSRNPYPPEVLAQMAGLTPSQKKRLRRKKAKENNRQPSPAPYPLQADMPQTNGFYPHPSEALAPLQQTPTFPEAPPEPVDPVQTHCGHETLVTFWSQGQPIVHRLVCPLSPWPHPNQPHLLKVDATNEDGTEIFVGWWAPGE